MDSEQLLTDKAGRRDMEASLLLAFFNKLRYHVRSTKVSEEKDER